jgi:transcriptional regulator with XRE-family HTH domain
MSSHGPRKIQTIGNPMKKKRKLAATEPSQKEKDKGTAENMSELCRAVKTVRLSYGESQEAFARRVGLASMTVSRFERGKLVPTSFEALLRLAEAARAKDLAESDLFERAAQHARLDSPETRPTLNLGAIPIYSLPQWRLMHIAAIAVLYYPEAATAMEQAASSTGPAVALVDRAIREYTNRSGFASGLGSYRGLPEILTMLAEQQAFENFKEKGNQ